ncbi:MAG: FAD-binding oxidoreductase [Devosia sp.]
MTKLDTVISALKLGLSGNLIMPGDAGYEAARTVTYGGIDKHPGVIVQVANAADVQLAVNAARDNGIEFAVRSGGHSNAGHSTIEGGLVIDLRAMKSIKVDAATKTATVATGATAGEACEAALEHGLVLGFGDAATVGVGGITLGGGVGYLVRKWGLTIDSLLSAEIVLADGSLKAASATENPDLFWALRGGGGNFGIVTSLEYRLHDLPEFTGGMICLPATAETIAGFVAAAEAAPDELSTIANVMPAPPMPFLSPELHGKLVILGMLAFAGDAASAEKAIAPFRALATPYADFIMPGSYMQMYPPEDPDYHPTAVARTMFMNRIGESEAAMLLDTLEKSDAMFRVTQLRVLGGAAARIAPNATAYAHRNSRIMVNVAAFYTTPDDKTKQTAWVEHFAAALKQSDDGAYVNFLGLESEARIRAAYPGATWDRLREAKAKYDPANLFRLNQNIVPAGA